MSTRNGNIPSPLGGRLGGGLLGVSYSLNFRPLTSGVIPRGLVFRSGKLSQLSAAQCRRLLERHGIGCVIDLRTPIEAEEFPDPLPPGIRYEQIPILHDSVVGFTHELGSDPISILRKLRSNPDLMWSLVPDFPALYRRTVTDDYSLPQLRRVVALIRQNMEAGIPTLMHCTAGKDRTGIASMALLKELGATEDAIVRDYMRSGRHLFLHSLAKSIGAFLIMRSWKVARIAYRSFMPEERLIRIAYESFVPSACAGDVTQKT